MRNLTDLTWEDIRLEQLRYPDRICFDGKWKESCYSDKEDLQIEKKFFDITQKVCYLDLKIGEESYLRDYKKVINCLIERMNNDIFILHISNKAKLNFHQTSLYDLELFYRIWTTITSQVPVIINPTFELKETVGKDTMNQPKFNRLVEFLKSKNEQYFNGSNLEIVYYSKLGKTENKINITLT